jgi:hypothetical protein
MLEAMVSSIVFATDPDTYRLIFVDNASSSPNIKNYLSELEKRGHTVVRSKQNDGKKAFNWGLCFVTENFFMISDPDIQLNKNMPSDWITQFKNALIAFPHINKIGVALNITFNSDRQLVKDIQSAESGYWEQSVSLKPVIEDACYNSKIDTTLAMYCSHNYIGSNGKMWFDPLVFLPAVRVAGRYTAEHLGWDVYNQYVDEFEYYKTHSVLHR